MDIAGESIVMKMDVRDYDWEVISGASGLFDAGRVKAVLSACSQDRARVLSYLENNGFRLFDTKTLRPNPHASVLAIHRSRLDSSG